MFFFRGGKNNKKNRDKKEQWKTKDRSNPDGGFISATGTDAAAAVMDYDDDDLEQLRESPIAVAWMQHREKYHQEQAQLQLQQQLDRQRHQESQQRPVLVLPGAPPQARAGETSSTDTLPGRSWNSNETVGTLSPNPYSGGGSDSASHTSGSLASDFTPVITNANNNTTTADDDNDTLFSDPLSMEQAQSAVSSASSSSLLVSQHKQADQSIPEITSGETASSDGSEDNAAEIDLKPIFRGTDTPLEQHQVTPKKSNQQNHAMASQKKMGNSSSNKLASIKEQEDDRPKSSWSSVWTLKCWLIALILLLLLVVAIITASVVVARNGASNNSSVAASPDTVGGGGGGSNTSSYQPTDNSGTGSNGKNATGNDGTAGGAGNGNAEKVWQNITDDGGENGVNDDQTFRPVQDDDITAVGVNSTASGEMPYDDDTGSEAPQIDVATIGPTVTSTTRVPTMAPTLITASLAPTERSTTTLPTSTPFVETAPNSAIPPLSIRMVQGRAAQEAFGAGLTLSGDGMVMVVGAPKASIQVGGTMPGQTINMGYAGIVSVYKLQQVSAAAFSASEMNSTAPIKTRWQQHGNLLAGGESNAFFGTAVVTSYNGSVVIVGEPGQDGDGDALGQVRAFVNTDNGNGRSMYQQLGQTLRGPLATSYFGSAIAASQNGNRIAVGAPYFSSDKIMQGRVSVFGLVDGEWQAIGEPLVGDGQFDWLGSAIDLSADGSVLVASAPRDSVYGGYVLAWRWDGSAWNRLGGLGMINTLSPATAEDRYGHSVSISQTEFGTYRVAIGVPFKQVGGAQAAGVVIIFEYNEAEDKWKRVADPVFNGIENDEFGSSVKLSMGGKKLVVGVPGHNNRAGLVSFYKLDTSIELWKKAKQDVKGANPWDEFGHSLAVAESEMDAQAGQITVAVGATADKSSQPGYVLSFTQQDSR